MVDRPHEGSEKERPEGFLSADPERRASESVLPALRAAATPGQLDQLAARIEQNKQRVG
jgi:hypothetical protein